MATSIRTLTEDEYLLPGNRTCPGCSLSVAFRHILKALEGKAIFVVPASCLTVLGGMYPVSSVRAPWLNVTFPSTAASASGVAAGLKATGRTGMTVVAFAGDGGTFDIGIQALSGAAERNADILYICYDNEAYMNTGTQRSGATPKGARTATTPLLGKQQYSKDMIAVMEAHHISYIATACSAYPIDLYDKVRKARDKQGTRYIQITAPCPPGWVFPTKNSIKVGRLAVDTGVAVLFEIEDGVFRLTGKSRTLAKRDQLMPVEQYVSVQRRFNGLEKAELDAMQDYVARRWRGYVKRDSLNSQA